MSDLPTLGIGIGYRSEISALIDDCDVGPDWLEIVTESFIRPAPDRLDKLLYLKGRYSLVPHGLEMSVGSPEDLDASYLDAVSELAATVDAPWFSDHLCFTRAAGVALGTLMPVPRTREAAKRAAGKAQQAQDRVGRPFLVENITYYLEVPGGLSEQDFMTEFLENCDCGLLLDVTNLYINSVNHGYDALEYIDALPAGRITQLHLAGVEWRDGVALDTHSTAIPVEVWELFSAVLAKEIPKGILIERDGNFPASLAPLIEEIDHAREILRGQLKRHNDGTR
jgi:uncharacterized protein